MVTVMSCKQKKNWYQEFQVRVYKQSVLQVFNNSGSRYNLYLTHNLPRFSPLVYKIMLISGSGQTSLSLPCFHLQSSKVVLNTDGLPRYNALEMTFCALES